jgi:CRISPR/Cas system-associated exonuclease Cas4 (RecB family)
MPVIRASEIGNYLYCRRAWWYRKKGYESANQAELAAGTELHHKHGRKALSALLLRTLGMILFLAAILLLVAFCTAQFV